MAMKTYKASNVPEYIAHFPKDVQKMLKQMRTTIKKAAPKATEGLSYGIPTLKQDGVLVHYAAFQKHIGFYPGSAGVAAFEEELKKFKTSKGGIQFPFDTKIPTGLVSKITKFRLKQNQEKKKRKKNKPRIFS